MKSEEMLSRVKGREQWGWGDTLIKGFKEGTVEGCCLSRELDAEQEGDTMTGSPQCTHCTAWELSIWFPGLLSPSITNWVA